MAQQQTILTLLLVGTLLVLRAEAIQSREELLIGWQGESYKPKQPLGKQPLDSNATGTVAPTDRRRWIETISWQPRAFIFHNFLSLEECDHIISVVEEKLARSSVVDSHTGAPKTDPIRTSYGAGIMRGQDAVIASIEQKIAEWTRLPAENGEPLQVLRYQNGQKYEAHWDWFDDPEHKKAESLEGNRVATVLMYLGEVQEGGETTLPLAEPLDAKRQALKNPSECAKKGTLAIVPKKGDALLFWDMLPDGVTVDRNALHASCPTLKGTKWTATKWYHNKKYGTDYDPLARAAVCADADTQCSKWAKEGKCDTDPSMIGVGGKCRKACGDCVECPPNDVICLRRNMRSLRRGIGQQQAGTQAV